MKYHGPSRLRRVLKWVGTTLSVIIASVWLCRLAGYSVVYEGRNWAIYSDCASAMFFRNAAMRRSPRLETELYVRHERELSNWIWCPARSRSWGWCNVPYWIPLLIVGLPTALLWYRDRRPPAGYCQVCAYDLTGNVSGQCSECGTKVERDPRHRGGVRHVAGTLAGPAFLVLMLGSIAIYVGLVNVELPFGYWGELNRVKWRLKGIPGVSIQETSYYRSVSLEDIRFELKTSKGKAVSLLFHETTPNNWQLFDDADGFMVRCPLRDALDSLSRIHNWWFDLGDDVDLELELGCDMKNLSDVLLHIDGIVELVESTPRLVLDEQRVIPESWSGTRYATILIHHPDIGYVDRPW